MAGLIPTRDQLTDERDSELWKSLENKDLYKVLGVPPDATAKDIERAYRKKARDVHPDKHTDALSTERFKELTNAKELLLDIGKRWWYDQRRVKEADVIARALEGARLRAKAKDLEEGRSQELAADDEKRRAQLKVNKERLAKFVEEALANSHSVALKEKIESSDEETSVEPTSKLRASAAEFVPGGTAASATPAIDRVVEVYSISAQRWCLGLVIGVCPLPGGRAAITVRYQVTDGPMGWHEKMLYDHDPNLRKRQSADDSENARATSAWNQWQEQQRSCERSDLRAEAPVFVPGAGISATTFTQPMPQADSQSSVPWPSGPPVAFPPHFAGPQCGPALRQLQVTVPHACIGGQHINILTRSGRPMRVQIPLGLVPGQTFVCFEGPELLPSVSPLLRQATPGQGMPVGAPPIRPPASSHAQRISTSATARRDDAVCTLS